MSGPTLALIIKAQDEASKVMRDVGGEAEGLGSKLGGIAKAAGAITLGGIAALTTGLIAGVKSAGDLEQAVANISTIKPEIDTSAVFGALNEMSTRVPQSASQLGDALYNVFSSIEVSQEGALQLVEKFARGAVGAATDAETFGTAVLGVMNAYKLGVEDADHISDVFFNTINKGVVTGQQLAAGLGPVTASAKAAGVSLDELGGLLVGVTKEGGDAAQNINNLNNFLQKITTSEARAELSKLGVATVDATGKFRPVADVLADLKAKLGTLTEAERANALQKIFPDAQARQGAQVLISQLDAVADAIKANRTEVGSASAAYEKMSATFNSQVTLLKNAFVSILTTVGAKVLPAITPVVTAFAKALPDAFKATGQALAPVAAWFGTVLWPALQRVGAALGPLVDWLSTRIPSALRTAAGAFGEIGRAIQAALALSRGQGLGGFVAQLVTQLGGLGKRLADEIGIQVGQIDWAGVWSRITTAGSALLSTAVTWVAGLASGLAGRIGDQVAQINWAGIWGKVTGFAEGLKQKIADTKFDEIGRQAATAVRDAFAAAFSSGEGAGDVGAGLAAQVVASVGAIDWYAIGASVGKVAIPFTLGFGLNLIDPGTLLATAQAHWPDLVLGALAITFAPTRLLGPLAGILGRIPLAGPLLEWLLRALNGLGGPVRAKLVELGGLFAEGLSVAFRDRLNLSFFPGAAAALEAGLTGLRGLAVRFGEIAFGWGVELGNGLARGVNLLTAPLRLITTTIEAELGALVGRVLAWGGQIIASLAGGIAGGMGSVGAAVAGVATAIGAPIARVVGQALAWGGQIIASLAAGMTGALGSVAAAIGGVLTAIAGFVARNTGAVMSLGATLASYFLKGIGDAIARWIPPMPRLPSFGGGSSGRGSSNSTLQARAAGGPVAAGRTYLVGERGPELYVPSASGSIVPNDRLGGRGGVTVSVTVAAGAVQVSGGTDGGLGSRVGQTVAAALEALVRAEGSTAPGPAALRVGNY